MLFLFENAAAIAVAAVVSLMGWLFGGTRGDVLLVVVPWVLLFLVEIMICFPQRYSYETTYEARERVWSDIRSDPLVWLAIGFGVLMLVPFVNKGLCPQCDYASIAAGVDASPPIKYLPFCVDRLSHLNTVIWFATAFVTAITAKHALLKSGKRLALSLIVWNGVLLAVFGFVQHGMGAPGPLWQEANALAPKWRATLFFSTFGYCNMAGSYFVLLFGLAVALWRDCCEKYHEIRLAKEKDGDASENRHMFWRKHYYLIPAIIIFYAALNTLSRAAIILAVVTATVYFFHTFVSFLSRRSKARRAWAAFWSMLAFGLIVLFSLNYAPDDIRREMDSLDTEEVLNRTTGKGVYQSSVAYEIWKDNFLFGCGGWGYKHLSVPKLLPRIRKGERLGGPGQGNVHNDYLQFLVEHGTVGFGMIVAFVVLLLVPVFKTWNWLIKGQRFKKKKDQPPAPIQIFALPAPAFCILTANTAVLIHAFGDCPLRSLAVLSLFFVSLSTITGFLPERNNSRN